ncbi:putative transposase [Kalymmatonema gypsitolerans NIES-4073]|nr:putative transposase [Scytonema sp. NIES-4073]
MNLVATAKAPLITLMDEGESKNVFDKIDDVADVSTSSVFGNQKSVLRAALMVGTLKTATYMQLMDWQARAAAHRLLETGQLTVIVHDNGSVHKSHLAREHHQRWHSACVCTSFFCLPIVLK